MATPIHKLAEIRVAVECCILAEGKVLLQKRPDDSKNFPGYWTLPGGHVDEGEDVLTAIIREVEEETGIRISTDQVKLKVLALNHHLDRKQVWNISAFRVDLPKLVTAQDSNEGECKWFDIAELDGDFNLFPPIKAYKEHILDANSGILYMSGDWENAQLVKQHTWVIDKDS